MHHISDKSFENTPALALMRRVRLFYQNIAVSSKSHWSTFRRTLRRNFRWRSF
jgi:hypothetical protein